MSRVWANLINVKFYDIITVKGDEFKMTIFILVIWMLLGDGGEFRFDCFFGKQADESNCYGNSAILYVMLGEIFGDAWEDETGA